MDKYLFYTFRVKGLERDLKATYITGANKGGISRRRNYYINIIYKLHQVLEAEESRNTKQSYLSIGLTEVILKIRPATKFSSLKFASKRVREGAITNTFFKSRGKLIAYAKRNILIVMSEVS